MIEVNSHHHKVHFNSYFMPGINITCLSILGSTYNYCFMLRTKGALGISEIQCGGIVDQYEDGFSERKIWENLSIPFSTVNKVTYILRSLNIHKYEIVGGARGVMVIVTGYGHGDTSSNPGWGWLHFT